MDAALPETRAWYARSCLTDSPEKVVRGCYDALQLYGVSPRLSAADRSPAAH